MTNETTGAGWRIVALASIAFTALGLLASGHDVLLEWHGDHFERVAGTFIVLAILTVIAVVLALVAVVGGRRSDAQRTAWVALAAAIVSPIAFVVFVLVWAFTR
jgi:hypothetical protein